MDSLFDAVKEAALTGIWAKGVKLARTDAVTLEDRSTDEAVFRVRSPGRAVAPTAVLYPSDEEWTCDCGSRNDPCEHIVAAVIAAKHASDQGESVPSAEQTGAQLAYRIQRHAGASVRIERVVVYPDGREEPLKAPLTTLIARRACPVAPSHDDLAADAILGNAARRTGSAALAPDTMEKLLRVLAGSKVFLDGREASISLEPVLPVARVVDSPTTEGGVTLSVDRDPRIDEVLDRGVARIGSVLHPLGATDLSGARLERLPMERTVEKREIGELVGKILPELEKEVSVSIDSKRLPKRGGLERPRIAFDMTPQGHTLSVLPTLVYGEPARARIDGDKLIHLGGIVPKRDRSGERELVAQLRDELNLVPGRVVHFDGHDAARFARKLRAFQDNARTNVDRDLVSKTGVEALLLVEGSSISLSFVQDGAGEGEQREASVEAVYRAWRDGLDLVPLKDGGWAPLPVDWMSRYGDRVADLLAARRPDGEVAPYALGRLAQVCEELGEPPPPGFDTLRPLFENFDKLPQAPLPEALTADLRPYQRQGVDWLSFLRDAGLAAILADDMGLGKTLQTLCALSGKTLVICPRSVVFNWVKEIQRFRPDLSVNVYHGPRRELDDADVTITTYAVLRLDIDTLEGTPWHTVVLDEAQAIKNPDSQSARAAYRLSESMASPGFRVALSGTPVENRLDELWSLFRFSHPGLLGSRSDFRERYSEPISQGKEDAAERLRQLTKPFLLRRLKRDVARDLPPRTDVVLTVELSDEERNLYGAIYAAKQKEVVAALEGGGGVMAALEALLRLRQAACHPSLVPGQAAASSSKVEALLDALDDAAADGHRAIVFSQWTSLLDLIEEELGRHEIDYVRLDGSTRDRGAVVDRFQADDGPPVLLSSLKAGGTGLNLTAADHVFLMDPWWNPAAEEQAAGDAEENEGAVEAAEAVAALDTRIDAVGDESVKRAYAILSRRASTHWKRVLGESAAQ